MRTFEFFDKMGNPHKRGISSTLAKMSRGETVSMSVLEKICMELDCDFGDLIHFEKDESQK